MGGSYKVFSWFGKLLKYLLDFPVGKLQLKIDTKGTLPSILYDKREFQIFTKIVLILT